MGPGFFSFSFYLVIEGRACVRDVLNLNSISQRERGVMDGGDSEGVGETTSILMPSSSML